MAMRVGDILVARGFVTVADIEEATARQRVEGGRLGDNLIALGKLTPEQFASVIHDTPPAPRSVAETGIAQGNLLGLMLKFMHTQPRETAGDLVDGMNLPITVVRELMDDAVQKKLIVAAGQVGEGMSAQIRYILSERGRTAANEALARNLYVGPTPVSLQAWQDQILRQRITNEVVDAAALKDCFKDLIIPGPFLQKIGPAANAGKTILLYGPPGNGKTSIATRLASIFKHVIYVPYAVEIDGQIMILYDASLHKMAVSEADRNTLTNQGSLRREEFDRRWVPCKRPIVMTGGELSLDMLDLRFSAESKFYEAPLHIKALNGTFLIDDFGRQLVSPEMLLNRWIVPMESRIEFLKLATGKSFSIPFDELIIFSTNLQPADLMDPAFLRRIPYKIKLYEPSKEDYRSIFRAVARYCGLDITDDIFENVCQQITEHGFHLAYYQPKFICDQVVNACKYEGVKPYMTPDKVFEALANLYVQIADRQSEMAIAAQH